MRKVYALIVSLILSMNINAQHNSQVNCPGKIKQIKKTDGNEKTNFS